MKKRILSVIAVLALAAVLAVAMVACIPSDPAKAADNLKEAEYTVVSYSSDDLGGLAGFTLPEGCTDMVSGTNLENDFDSVTIYYFEDAGAAKAFMDSDIVSGLNKETDEMLEELESAYKAGEISENDYNEMKDLIENTQIKRQGKIVYAGTKDAIKAAR